MGELVGDEVGADVGAAVVGELVGDEVGETVGAAVCTANLAKNRSELPITVKLVAPTRTTDPAPFKIPPM